MKVHARGWCCLWIPLVAAGMAVGCTSEQKVADPETHVGRWVRAAPRAESRVWMILSADGTAAGNFTYAGTMDSLPLERWV